MKSFVSLKKNYKMYSHGGKEEAVQLRKTGMLRNSKLKGKVLALWKGYAEKMKQK